MIFENNKSRSIANFSIDLSELIAPYYNLIIDIAGNDNDDIYKQLESIFATENIQLPCVNSEILKDSFLAEITSYLTELLYESLDKLKDSDILLLHLRRNIIIFKGEDSSIPKKILNKWIKSFSPVEKMFDLLINNDKVKKYRKTVCGLINDISYSSVIRINCIEKYNSVAIPSKWIKGNSIFATIIDSNDIWININKWSEIDKSLLQDYQFEAYEIFLEKKYIGVEIGSYLISIQNIDEIIKPDFQKYYFWNLLKNVFVSKFQGDTYNHSTDFKNTFKDGNFCKILSHLKHNLYIEYKELTIPLEYLCYFDQVYNIGELPHISDFNLFTGVTDNLNEKSLLGIYSHTKKGSEYNLLHWVVGKTEDKAHIFSGSTTCKDINLIIAFALKPQYSYYYISKFFEDIFVDILEELDVEYMNNINLSYSGHNNSSIEIDSMIKGRDGSIIIIENKTNLSKENIESTLRKFEKLHSIIINQYNNVDIKYILVAPYSNPSVDEGFHYFIKNHSTGKEIRDGYKCTIYDFKIPFAQFENLELRCLVEPEYSKLKDKIQAIL